MAEESGSRAKRSRRRRVFAFACAGLVALLAGAVLLRDDWLEPLALRYVRERARELGAELAIERISGGWFGGVTLEGVSWRSARPPLLAVRAARIELAYTLYGAWKGEPELAVRVQASGIDLALGAERTETTGTGGGLPDLAELELDLTELVVRLPGREPEHIESLRGSGSLRAGTARAEELVVVAGPNRLDFADVELDTTRRDWIALVRSARGELVATLEDAQVLEDLVGRELGLRSAELTLAAEHGTARIRGHAALANGRLEIARGELRLPEQGGLGELQLDLGLAAEISDLAPFEEVFGQPLEGRWSGAIDVRGPVRAPSGRFVGRGEALRVAGLALDLVDLDVETDGKLARLERCEISGPELEAVLRGGLSLAPLELVDVAMNVSADRTPLAVLLPFPCEHAFFHARLDGPPRAPRGAFELSAEGVEVGGVRIDDAESRGTIAADVLEVAEVRLTSGESLIEAAGTLRRSGADFTADLGRLAIAWRETRAELERGARLEFGRRRFAVEGLELSSEGGGETGRARIAVRHEDGVTRGSLDFERYDAGPLLAPFLPEGWKAGRTSGRVEGELGAQGIGGTPAVTLDLALAGWSVSPAWPEMDAELRGSFDGKALALEEFALGFGTAEATRAHGTLRVPCAPRAPLSFGAGPVELALELETRDAAASLRRAGLEPGVRSTGTSRLALDLTGEWQSLSGSASLRAADIRFGTADLEQTCDLEARLELGERVRLERSLLSAPSGTIALSGELGIPLDLPRWTSDRWVLLEAPLALDAEIEHADLAWITGMSDELRRVSGRLAGRVSVSGTALEPEFGGALELREGELRLAARNAPPVRDISADLTLDGDVVNVVTLTGDVGGAPVRVSGTLEPFGPFPRLDLELDGKNLLLARNSRLVLRSDLDLVVKGTPSQLAIRGEMAVAEGRYTTEFSPFEEILRRGRRGGGETRREARFAISTEGLLADAELDVHIGGERTFEYRSNLLEASVRPDLRLKGTGAFPVFEGPMYVEEASLSLPSGSLKATSGILTFAPETGLVPEVALTAEMRIARHNVRASITGPLNGPLEIVLSSSPPLAQDDLWLLVLTGQLPPETASDRSTQALEALATFLAQDTLMRWFGTDEEDAESLLERFEIDVGARTSQSGQRTGRVLFYLRTPDPRSGRATYLSAERDEYDRYNYALGIVFRPAMMTRAALVLAALALGPSMVACKAAEEAQEKLPFALELEFEGQETVGPEALEELVRRELVRLEVEKPDKAVIDDAAFALELFYRSRGHADVKVDYEFVASDTAPLARFEIHEGPAVRVRELVIEGALAFDLAKVREHFGEAASGGVYNESQIENSIGRLRATYRSEGYQRIEIEDPRVEFDATRTTVSIWIVLREGPKFDVREIEFEGGVPELAPREQQIADARTNLPYVPQVLAEIEHSLVEAYRREGYPDVTVAVAPGLDEQSGGVRLSVRIAPGERVTIAHFRLQGNERTKDAAILELIGIEHGTRYDSERLRESFRDLYATGLFESVTFELEGTGPERTLVVDLVEARSVEIRIEPGWGSYEGPRFLLGIEERNFLGRGQVVSVEGTASLRAQALRLGWIDRDFLGTNFTSETSAFIEKREEPSFEYVRRGLGFFLGRELGNDWRTSFGYEFRPTSVTDEDIPMAPDDEIEIATLSVAITLEDRDNILLPTRGRQGRLKLEVADDGLGSQTEFLRGQLEYTHLFRLSRRGVLAASGRTGVIAPYGNTASGEIPLPERFFNGGENSVRSFREDQLPAEPPSDFASPPDPPFDVDSGGEASTTLNLELRRRLSGNLAVALFYDVGNVSSDARDYLRFDGFRSGIGVGLRYLLPIGPVRLDLGYNPDARNDDLATLNEDEEEDDFVLHFSVGFPF